MENPVIVLAQEVGLDHDVHVKFLMVFAAFFAYSIVIYIVCLWSLICLIWFINWNHFCFNVCTVLGWLIITQDCGLFSGCYGCYKYRDEIISWCCNQPIRFGDCDPLEIGPKMKKCVKSGPRLSEPTIETRLWIMFFGWKQVSHGNGSRCYQPRLYPCETVTGSLPPPHRSLPACASHWPLPGFFSISRFEKATTICLALGLWICSKQTNPTAPNKNWAEETWAA